MTRTEKALALIALFAASLALFPLPARAQKSETVQQLEVLRDIISSQSKSIEALAGALAQKQQPVFVGGMPMQQPTPQVIEEKPCEDSLIGCALRGLGSILLKAGGKGIDFLDRNAVPLLQVVSSDRREKRAAEASVQIRDFDYRERRDVAQANAASVQSLGMNLERTANGAFTVFAGLPPQTVYTLNNAQGINFGTGALNFAPISDSYKPVNPTPRICGWIGTGATATFVCQ